PACSQKHAARKPRQTGPTRLAARRSAVAGDESVTPQTVLDTRGSPDEDRPVHRGLRGAARRRHRPRLLGQPRRRLLLRRHRRDHQQPRHPQPAQHPELLHGPLRHLVGAHAGGRAPRPADHLRGQLRDLGARAVELARPRPDAALHGLPARLRDRSRPRVVAAAGARPVRGSSPSRGGGRALLRPGAPQQPTGRPRGARSALLCVTLYLGAFLAFMRRRWALGAALFALALLTKAIALTLPAMLLIHDFVYRDRTR